jgi:L,D-peptidoglycan transpeptidase YkuD (ErfK/YbiS/YcfS/YnhG family)
MDIEVTPAGRLIWPGGTFRCALGRDGIRSDKREGDGGTPTGCFPLRRVLFRADRMAHPATGLPASAIAQDDGWCDDPRDAAYNRPVRLPYAASHEKLWRDDSVYDVIVVLGHNDDPVIPDAGSAVFLHVARPNYEPTEGCVALAVGDLLRLLADCAPGDRLCVRDDVPVAGVLMA